MEDSSVYYGSHKSCSNYSSRSTLSGFSKVKSNHNVPYSRSKYLQ